MTDRLTTPEVDIDRATIHLDELAAFTALLSTDEVAAAFGRMDTIEQATIFGALETLAKNARNALVTGLEVAA